MKGALAPEHPLHNHVAWTLTAKRTIDQQFIFTNQI